MFLRAATMSDLPELLDVQQAGAQAGLAHIFPQAEYPFPRARVEAQWASEIASADIDAYVTGRREDRIEGFAALRANELLHFGTAVETWGTGLAAAVHGELVARLASSGKPAAWLHVFERNGRARRFYEKMGWTPTPRLTRSAFPPYPSLVRYELALVGVGGGDGG